MKRSKQKAARPVVKVSRATGSSAPNLGECLRTIRFRKRMSIADVSAATGLARSTLSRVEKDQLSLTYDRLVQLSEGLQIDFTELFSAQLTEGTRHAMARRAFTLPGGGRPVTVGRHVYNYVCTDLPGKRMTPMTADIKARSLEETNGFQRHEGEEFTYVLEGTLELHTEFYEPLTVEAGGSVYFDSTMGHTYVAAGDRPLRIVCVCSAGESTLTQVLRDLANTGDSAASTAATQTRSRRSAKARG